MLTTEEIRFYTREYKAILERAGVVLTPAQRRLVNGLADMLVNVSALTRARAIAFVKGKDDVEVRQLVAVVNERMLDNGRTE